MDLKASVAHYKDIVKKSGGMGKSITEEWNKWAKNLMQEREWDEEQQNYLKPTTSEWEQKASLTYNSNTFRLNQPHKDQEEKQV